MQKIDPSLIKDIKKYGAFDVTACFNCGNCTAVCPLSKDDSSFPRKMIRWANTGMKAKLLSQKEMWMCYYCGECSKTCPREAKPAAFMAAARRYAIADNDLTGISKLLYRHWPFNLAFWTLVIFVLGSFMYVNRLESRGHEKIIEIFNIPYELIHNTGIFMMAIAAFSLAAGLVRMILKLADSAGILSIIKEKKPPFPVLLSSAVKSAADAVFGEMFAFKRFRECDADKKIPERNKPWMVHAVTAWGFMGLFLATTLNFLFKDPELLVAVWYPPRVIGIISGVMLMYGATRLIINRIKKSEPAYANSVFSDWLFLWLLWFIGLTGFVLLVLVYLPEINRHTADLLFIVHVAPSMALVVLASVTKLAHVFYRPLALFIHKLKDEIKNYIAPVKAAAEKEK